MTLSSIRDYLKQHLSDLSSLVWPTASLDEAIRTALRQISHAYDVATPYTLSGLDGAGATTLPELLRSLLVTGAAAHALTFRVIGRFEEATPTAGLQETLARFATERMNTFLGFLTEIETQTHGDDRFLAENTHELLLLSTKITADMNAATARYAHEIARDAAKFAADAARQAAQITADTDAATAQHTHELARDAAKFAQETAENAAKFSQETTIQTAEHAQETARDTAKFSQETTVQTAEHGHQTTMQGDQHTHELARDAAKAAADAAAEAAKQAIIDAAIAAEQTRLEELQESTDHPYDQWEWEE
jgi:hypothetical protein